MKITKIKKRIFHVLLLLVIGIFALGQRLYVIQIKDTKDFSDNHVNLLTNSVNQRNQEFILSSGRGNIFDRNMNSLLEQRSILTAIVFPFSKQMLNNNKIKELANILHMSEETLKKQIVDLKGPSYLTKGDTAVELTNSQKSRLEKLSIPGVIAIPYTIQNSKDIVAKHVIGYLGQAPSIIKEKYSEFLERGVLKTNSLIGRSGLEMTFQELLMGLGESKIAYYVDNQGKPLNGLGFKYQLQEDSFYPLSLVTTLDSDIQNIAELQLKKFGIRDGSVVVLDAETADILAMASSPDFDLQHVDPNSRDWNNKGVQVVEPGSTFKTLIAIAGLSEGVVSPNERFYCSGENEKYHFTCHEAHGELTFAEGYADSCNIVFAEVAQRLGPDKIEEYANRLGLVGKVGWSGEFFKNHSFEQVASEEPNRVFHENTNTNDPGSIMRTGIGQQDVRMSPLALANLVVTILHDGKVYEPRLVERLVYKNGMDYFYFSPHSSTSGTGNRYVYSEIRELMGKVVNEGTGTILKQATWNIAGKTGTAETTNNLTNQWFIGYGPTENPKYAMAVVVKDVGASGAYAKKVFMGVMDELARRNN